MRTIMYAVIEKATNKRVFINTRGYKCEEFLNNLPNKDDFRIGYKWMSI